MAAPPQETGHGDFDIPAITSGTQTDLGITPIRRTVIRATQWKAYEQQRVTARN